MFDKPCVLSNNTEFSHTMLRSLNAPFALTGFDVWIKKINYAGSRWAEQKSGYGFTVSGPHRHTIIISTQENDWKYTGDRSISLILGVGIENRHLPAQTAAWSEHDRVLQSVEAHGKSVSCVRFVADPPPEAAAGKRSCGGLRKQKMKKEQPRDRLEKRL